MTIDGFFRSLGPRSEFEPHLFLNGDGQCAEVFLEDVPQYLDWIPGEGGDIGLYRAMDDNRIVGACLRLCQQRLTTPAP